MNSLIHKARTGLVTIAGTALYGMNTVMAQSGFLQPTDSPGKVTEATGGETSARALVLTIVNFFLGFLGLIAVLMVIYGGVLVLTSGSNPEQAGKGKKILLYAALGIIIILLSFAFVSTILGAGSGQEG
jgi:Type IV secretion system pilin